MNLKYDTKWITEKLPPIERVWRRSEPDSYGASYLIAQQTSRKKPPVSFAHWRHGWNYLNPVIHPRLLGGDPDLVHLMTTAEQVQVLNDFGYKKVFAVGLPYIYADNFKTDRKAGSLLVMPGHSLPYTNPQLKEHNYVRQMADLRPYFSTIVACLHSSCFAKGLWISQLEKYGIPYIIGADSYDKNSLSRMNHIFKSFEYMTTNRIGSHVAYAAYSGCKVSIFGEYFPLTIEEYANDPHYRQYPDLMHYLIEKSQKRDIEKEFPELFVVPWEAPVRKDWGDEVVGKKHKRSPAKIAKLLGWSLKDQIIGHVKISIRLLRNPKSIYNLMRRKEFAQKGINFETKAYKF
jgi:hypothetical protein